MTFFCLGVTLALSAFLAIHLLASFVVALIWRSARREVDSTSAQSRADGTFLLRVFPATTAAIVILAVFLPAFCRFEPRQSGEMVGRTLVLFAALSSLLMVRALVRGWRAASATRRIVRQWLIDARPVTLPGMHIRAYAIRSTFPVVSVVGVLRRRVFVSERVLRECSAEELAAMVRHERGHLAAADNLKRLVLRACPALLPPRVNGELERHWQEACEEAADDYASAASVPSALALARALVHIAHMASRTRTLLPAASLYQGGDSIERRVRRLLGASPRGASRVGWLVMARGFALVPLVLAVVVLADTNLLHSVHHLIEAVVETLP